MTPTHQDASLLAKRRKDADVDAILKDLFAKDLAKPVHGPREFFNPSGWGELRKSVAAVIAKGADTEWNWRDIMAQIVELLKSHGITNAEDAARRICAYAEKK
jgi:hypothetical protein